MRIAKIVYGTLISLGMVSAFSTSASAQSISVSNVTPANFVTANSLVTVTAQVNTTGLANGTYKVTGSITNITGGGTPTQFSGTVVITNGVGNVSISGVAIPNGVSGNLGKTSVQVDDSLQGALHPALLMQISVGTNNWVVSTHF